MGGMSTRNEIKARLGILAEPKTAMARPGAKAKMATSYESDNQLYDRVMPSIIEMNQFVSLRIPSVQSSLKETATAAKRAAAFGEKILKERAASPEMLRELDRLVSVVKAQYGYRITQRGASFSRPGAKAKMAYRHADASMWSDVRRSFDSEQEAEQWLARQGWKRRRVNTDGEIEYAKNGALAYVYTDELSEPRIRMKGGMTYSSRNASRPGAKAKMDLTDVQRKAGYKWRVAYTRQLGKDQYLGGPPVTMQDDLLFATESAARQWADTMLKKGWFKGQGGGPEKILKATVLMASRIGAKSTHAAADKPGRKVMAESDPAVSAKIRKLMAEGKPQKQAVAIALDMKRRGEI
jgi:hypothetical protein